MLIAAVHSFVQSILVPLGLSAVCGATGLLIRALPGFAWVPRPPAAVKGPLRTSAALRFSLALTGVP